MNRTIWDYGIKTDRVALAVRGFYWFIWIFLTPVAVLALLKWDAADFTGNVITLNLAAGSANEWSLIDAATDTNYGQFDVRVDGVSIVTGTIGLNDQIASGDYAGWGFTLDENVLKFKQLA